MDVCSVIRTRLAELGLEQKDLAKAAEVTESYISQLLNGKKLPPAPSRTDIYEKLGKVLKLSHGELEKLAAAQRMDALRRNYEEPQGALLKETRNLILRKCVAARQKNIRSIFERQPFGELERLVTKTLLDVVSRVAKSELDNQTWLEQVAQLGDRTHEQMRVIILEFLDTDIFNISHEDCASFLDPLIARWDIDLSTFDMEITLNERLVPGEPKRLAFIEKSDDSQHGEQPGLTEFIQDSVLSGDLSEKELEFLRKLSFKKRRPNRLFYYRALQILRDPLHFLPAEGKRKRAP
jgi:transcriptional regulator with XRE-family HTH domain